MYILYGQAKAIAINKKIRKEKEKQNKNRLLKRVHTKWQMQQRFTLSESHFNLIFIFPFHTHTHTLYVYVFQEGYQSDQAVGVLTAQKQQEVGTQENVYKNRRIFQERTRNTTLSKYP